MYHKKAIYKFKGKKGAEKVRRNLVFNDLSETVNLAIDNSFPRIFCVLRMNKIAG